MIAMIRALARGTVAKLEMAETAGGCVSAGEVAKLLGITEPEVHRLHRENTILAVPVPGLEWGFPARQFRNGELRPELPEVLRAASRKNPWWLLSILIDPVPGSEDTILLDALDRPEVLRDVLNRIATHGHHGAS
jgi:hypothetical protein